MGLTLSLQRLTQAAQRFAQRPVRMIRQLGGRVVSSAISAIGGAALVFRILSYKGVITPDSPLWYLVDGARILNYPSDGDPSANSAAPGGKKPSRTEAIFAWTAVRLSAVRQWVYTNGATFAGALYAVFNSFPVIQVPTQLAGKLLLARAASSALQLCACNAPCISRSPGFHDHRWS